MHAAARYEEAADLFRACLKLLPLDPAPFLNLAASLLELGQVEAARDMARRARRRAPNLAATHYRLGLALLAANRLAEAEVSFAAAPRLDPNFVDAWVNLGVARYRRGDIEDGKTAMRRALALDPAHRAATANLAAFLRLTGGLDEAETLLRELLARDPGADAARVNLAVDLLTETRPGEALALLDEQPAPAQWRLRQHWLAQRALALVELGQPAEARAALAAIGDAPRGLAPLIAWRRVLIAAAMGDIESARREAHEMEASLAAPSEMLPEHRIMAHFDLARFWNREGEADRGLPYWREGHRLLGRFQPFSRDAHRDWVDHMVAQFGGARLRDGPRASNRDPAPVFIVGMPRSGTTLCEQIIAAHPQAHGAGERNALTTAYVALTIAAGLLTGGGGTGSSGQGGGTDGQHYGTGIFVQGNQIINFSPAPGEVLTVADDIADMTGSNDPSRQTGTG